MNLPISLIISVSAVLTQLGISEFNTSNIALFTHEPYAVSFGSLGYNIYFGPSQAGIDFGTNSITFQMVNSIFSQTPSIIANDGYVVVIPFVLCQQTLALSAVAASGSFIVNYGGHASSAINWNDSISQIQTKIQAILGLSEVTVTGSIASESLVITFFGIYGPVTLVTISSNTLETAGSAAITVTPSQTVAPETIAAAITRTVGLVSYFGILATVILSQTDMLAAAAVVQPLLLMEFFGSRNVADIEPGGMLDLLRSGSFSQSRGLYYGASAGVSSDLNTLLMVAAYAGRGLSVNFDGVDTTLTMNLATLNGIQPDSSMTSANYTLALNAGADIYASIQGSPSVISFGANQFFDAIYNLIWFKADLAVNGFNYLKGTNTKIPQTEEGMDGLKSAYAQSCVTGVTNGYLAPGSWTSAVPFGNQKNFLNAISQYGYFIYSTPISQQAAAARASRTAPVCQIAAKQAGAIHSSDVLVVVNQ